MKVKWSNFIQKIGVWYKTHKEVWLLLCFPIAVIAFMLINKYVPPIWTAWVPVDDQIPFITYFIIPYTLWYVVYAGSLIFFLFKEKRSYLRLCLIMFGGLFCSTLVYLIAPNHAPFENVHPEGDGFFVWWVNLIRGGATRNTAFPSQHCLVVLAVDVVVQRSEFFKKRYVWRTLSFLFMITVCLATVFLKQHSVIDMFGSLIIVLVLNLANYCYDWYCERHPTWSLFKRKRAVNAPDFAAEGVLALTESAALRDNGEEDGVIVCDTVAALDGCAVGGKVGQTQLLNDDAEISPNGGGSRSGGEIEQADCPSQKKRNGRKSQSAEES